jgi:hypothetical protein
MGDVFLLSTLVGGEWSASRHGRFSPRETSPVPIRYEALLAAEPIWTRWRSVNSWPYWDSNYNPSVVQPVASRYTDCTISALDMDDYDLQTEECSENKRGLWRDDLLSSDEYIRPLWRFHRDSRLKQAFRFYLGGISLESWSRHRLSLHENGRPLSWIRLRHFPSMPFTIH